MGGKDGALTAPTRSSDRSRGRGQVVPDPRAADEDSELEDGQRPLGLAGLSAASGYRDAGGPGPRVGGERGGHRPAKPEEAARPWGTKTTPAPAGWGLVRAVSPL